MNSFDVVREHAKGDVVIAALREPEYYDARIVEVVEPRGAIFGLSASAGVTPAAWFRDGFARIDRQHVQGVRPIRDDLLVHEYFWRPLR